ncbi:MAG: ribosome small subunit-dependent GTPase A [Bacteroidales bacterium]|jgi:ribosome biogenesis GTPase|nr:ribosome small subunit-dependent GTPase A [Bacteroidales bacterium]
MPKPNSLEKGTVIKSTGSRYKILTGGGNVVESCIRGKLRMNETRKTNPIAVGDEVLFETDRKTGAGIITALLDRRNYILRKSSNLSRHSQVIAANIDQALLMITVKMPETPVEFIDRFLVSAEAYRIPAIILINKTDLYQPDDLEKMYSLESMYRNIGYRTMHFSITAGFDPQPLVELMKNKVSLISGNSGTGKSSLLNTLNPQLRIRTEKISDYHLQGKHITTYPEMYPMPFGGFAIDTPGIRGFGVVDMERNEISHFFPEIFKTSKNCRFGSCLHIDEPGCAVKEALACGAINPLRYRSYLNIVEADDRKYR